MTEDIGDN